MGRAVAACTRDTITGSGAISVINQEEATSWVQVPTLETRVAIQSIRKIRIDNTLRGVGVSTCREEAWALCGCSLDGRSGRLFCRPLAWLSIRIVCPAVCHLIYFSVERGTIRYKNINRIVNIY